MPYILCIYAVHYPFVDIRGFFCFWFEEIVLTRYKSENCFCVLKSYHTLLLGVITFSPHELPKNA
jgi:hypothetical protein